MRTVHSRMAGWRWVAKSELPIFLPTHPLEKSAPNLSDFDPILVVGTLFYSYSVYLSALPLTNVAGYFLLFISSLPFAASTGSILSFSANSVR